MQYYTGKPAGSRMDAGANVLPFQISLAAQIPHAVGLAWGLRIQGSTPWSARTSATAPRRRATRTRR